jgi:predicted outer membrane repeat protein
MYVKADAAGSADGSSWNDAFPELWQALAASATLSPALSATDPLLIEIAVGTYKPKTVGGPFADVRRQSFELPSHVTLHGGNGGRTVLSGDIGAATPGAVTHTTDPATFPAFVLNRDHSGFKDNVYNVLRTVGGTNIALRSLTITGGRAIVDIIAPLTHEQYGARLESMAVATPGNDLTGSPVVAVDTNVVGGGVAVLNAFDMVSSTGLPFARPDIKTPTVIFEDCTFVGNAAAGYGGAVGAHEAIVMFRDTSFYANQSGIDGGAIWTQNSFGQIRGGTFQNNLAAEMGGAVRVSHLPSARTLTQDNANVDAFGALRLTEFFPNREFAVHGVDEGAAPLAAEVVRSYLSRTRSSLNGYGAQTTVTDPTTEAKFAAVAKGSAKVLKTALKDKDKFVSPAKALANGGIKSVATSAYAWVGLGVGLVDLGTNIALLAGTDPNDPFVTTWGTISANFNAYATPTGLAETFVNQASRKLNYEFEATQEYRRDAIFYTWLREFQIVQSTFKDNAAGVSGGAIDAAHCNVLIEGVRFERNSAVVLGGAVSLTGFSLHRVISSAFLDNTSKLGASALFLGFRVNAHVLNDTFIGNTSESPAGYALHAEMGAMVMLGNSILWDNHRAIPSLFGGANASVVASGADLFAPRREDLDDKGKELYDSAGDEKFKWVGTIDARFCIIQSLASIPLGTGRFSLTPDVSNAADAGGFFGTFSGSSSEREQMNLFNHSDDYGTLFNDGFPNVGEGVRETLRKPERYNSAADPQLANRLIPVAASPALDLGDERLHADRRVGRATNRDVFDNSREVGDRIDIGAAESDGGNGIILYVNRAATGANTGLSWANAFTNLQSALATANGGAEVWVAKGTYYPAATNSPDATFQLVVTTKLYGGFIGTETELAQRNPTANPTILSGRLSDISPGATSSYNIMRNFLPGGGRTGTIIDGFTFTGGRAFGGDQRDEGGAINSLIYLTIRNCVFTDNRATNNGGAVKLERGDISGSRFDNNQAKSGGAVYFATTGQIDRSIFLRNSATRTGGAVAFFGEDQEFPSVTNSLFARNAVTGDANGSEKGGAIYTTSSLRLQYDTIVDNTLTRLYPYAKSDGGAGVQGIGFVGVENSIVTGNTLSGTGLTATIERRQLESTATNTGPALDHSLVEGLDEFRGDIAKKNFDGDPAFSDRPNDDYRPLPWSPVIDAGFSSASGPPVGDDLAGNARRANVAPDLGAYELQSAPDPRFGPVVFTPACGDLSTYTFAFSPPTGTPLSPQWQVDRRDGAGFVPLSNGGFVSGAQSLSLLFTNPPTTVVAWRVRLTSTNGYYSAIFTVPAIGASRLYVRPSAPGAVKNGLTWNEPFTKLEDAIAAAAASGSPCVQIWVAEGTYQPPVDGTTGEVIPWVLRSGVALLGGFHGGETSAAQRDPKLYPTILSGEARDVALLSDNLAYLFNNQGNVIETRADRTAVLDGFTLRRAAKAAILNRTASPTIRNCIFEENAGAVENTNNATPLLVDCIFRRNHGQNGAVSDTDSASTIERCIFRENVGGIAAAFLATRSATVINNSVFWQNETNRESAVVSRDGSVVTIYRSVFWGNYSVTGGIPATRRRAREQFLEAGGTVVMFNCLVDSLPFGTPFGAFAYDALFNDPGANDFSLSRFSPAIALGAGPVPFTGTPVALPLHIFESPTGATLCGLGGQNDYTVRWSGGPTQPFAIQWEVDSGAGFVPVASSGRTFSLINISDAATLIDGQTLRIDVPAVPVFRLRYRDTLSGFVSGPITTVAAPVRTLRVDWRHSSGPADGLTWTTAYPTLEAALAVADACTEIWVHDGVYNLPANLTVFQRVAIFGGFNGTEAARDQRGTGITELRGTLILQNAVSGSVLDRLTLTGTTASQPALYISFGAPRVVDCVISHPIAAGSSFAPGAAFVQSGFAFFEGCTFLDSAQSAVVVTGGARFDTCVFRNNHSAGRGGAIRVEAVGTDSPTTTVDRCRFEDNSSAWEGGAIFAGGRVAVTNSIFSGNRAGARGGAVSHRVELTFVNNAVYRNYAPAGGGLYLNGVKAQIANSIFWENTESATRTSAAIDFKADEAQIYRDRNDGTSTVGQSLVQNLDRWTGSANSALAPLWFRPEAGDFHLDPHSPAIDGGTLAALSATDNDALDVYGFVRVGGSAVDIGPVEFAGAKLTAPAFTSLPASLATCVGRNSDFLVTGPDVTWARSANQFSGFASITDGGTYSITYTGGVARLRVLNTQLSDDQAWFRFTETVSGYTSPAVLLDVNPPVALRVKAGSVAATPDGLTWATAFPTVQAALAVADRCNTVWIAEGTYAAPSGGLYVRPGVQLLGGFSGVESDVAERRPDIRFAILEGDKVFDAGSPDRATDLTSIVDGVKVHGGMNLYFGDGMRFVNCTFEGSAFFARIDVAGTSPRFEQCRFSGYTTNVFQVSGGAPVLVDCTLASNSGSAAFLEARAGAIVRFENVTLRQQSALLGMAFFEANTEGVFVGGRFSANSARELIVAANGSTVSLAGTVIDHNTPAADVLNANVGGTLRLAHVTLYENQPSSIQAAVLAVGGKLEIANSIAWGNRNGATGATLLSQLLAAQPGSTVTFASSIVEGTPPAGPGNTAFDPLLADPSADDFTPLPISPAVGSAGAVPDWAVALLPAGIDDRGAIQIATPATNTVTVLRQPGSVSVYRDNPATFFVDVPAGTQSGVVWEISTDNGATFGALPIDGTHRIDLTSGRSTLVVLNASTTGVRYRYRIPANSFTGPATTLSVLPRRVLYVRNGAGGGGTGLSWPTAFGQVEEAIAAASSNDEIWVTEGSYTFRAAFTAPGVELYGGFAGNETLRTGRDPVARRTTLRGSFTIFGAVTGVAATAVFDGLDFVGGAISGANVSVLVRNCNFTHAPSVALGTLLGSLQVENSTFTANPRAVRVTGLARFTNCTFTANGAVGLTAFASDGGNVTLDRCTFADGTGGYALLSENGTLAVTRSTFSGNAAGAVRVAGPNNIATFVNTRFHYNRATDGIAGSALEVEGGTTTVTACSFFANSSTADSSALRVLDGAVTVSNTILWGATAQSARTLEFKQALAALPGTLTLSNSIIEGLAAYAGTNNLGFDPLFTSPPGNLELRPDSPAINAGSAAVLPAGMTVDFSGNLRVAGATPDIGAVEFQGTPTTPMLISRQPVSVVRCVGGRAEYTVDIQGLGTSVVWDYSPAHTVTSTANSSTLIIDPVPDQPVPVEIRYSIAAASYTSPAVTLTVGPVNIIYVRADAAAGGDGTSWATAFRTVEAAITAWNTCSEIWVANGVYSPASVIQLSEGMRIRGGFLGTESDPVYRPAPHVGTILVAPLNATLLSAPASATRATQLERLVLRGNGTTSVAFSSAGSSVVLRDSWVELHGHGAGAVVLNGGNPLFERVIFRNNPTYAVRAFNAANPTLAACTFTGNSQPDGNFGSALRVEGASASAFVADAFFSANQNGAVHAEAGTTLTILRSVFFDNTGDRAGAIATSGTLDLRHSVLARNSGRLGGAVRLEAAASGTFVHDTIADNVATADAGGIALIDNAGTIRNSILWNNRGGVPLATIERQQIGAAAVVTRSIVEGLALLVGNGNSGYDPLFSPFTLDAVDHFVPSRFSPAIEAGDASVLGVNDTLALDLYPRVAGTAPDAGAFEVSDLAGRQAVQIGNAFSELATTAACADTPAVLTVTGAAATIAAVQWQRRNGLAWEPLTSGGIYTITTTATTSALSVQSASPTAADQYYRYVIAGTDFASPLQRVTSWDRPVLRVRAGAPANGDGLSWATAFNSLPAAVALAGGCTDIWIAAGDYSVASTITLPKGVSLLGGFAGNETLAEQRNPSTQVTQILGSTSDILAFTNGAGASNIIDGLTLAGAGRATTINQASPIFRDVKFTGQTQYAVRVGQAPAFPVFERCTFDGARLDLDPSAGGGAAAIGATVDLGNFIGGGLQARQAQTVVVTNSTFTGAGTIQLTTVTDARFTNCSLAATRLSASQAATLAVTDCEIFGNTGASVDAGALRVGPGATVTVTRSVLRNNAARAGGAVLVDTGGALTMRQCVLRENSATDQGGALWLDSTSTVNLFNCTIAYNAAVLGGGGIYSSSNAPVIRNSILWANSAEIHVSSSIETAQIFLPSLANTAATISSNVIEGLNLLAGNGNSGIDPLLTPLERGLLGLDAYSPAIDTANDAVVIANETDARGRERIQFLHVDPGAVEARVRALTPTFNNSPRFTIPTAFTGAHFTAQFIFPTGLAARLGTVTWTWQINTGSGWRDIVANTEGKTTTDSVSSQLQLYKVPSAFDGAQLRLIARRSGNTTYLSAASTLSVLSPQVARVDPAVATPGNGTNWSSAYATLAAALSAAADGSINELWLAAGSYPGGITLRPGLSIYGGFAGTETDRTQRVFATAASVIQGGTNVVTVDGSVAPLGNETVVDGVTLSGGASGALVFQAAPIFRNVTFRANTAHGVNISGTTALPIFENCRFTDNTGVSGVGVNLLSGGAVLDRCAIAGNDASGFGAGLANTGGTLTVRSSRITGNRATDLGAGMLLEGAIATTLYNVTVADNRSAASSAAGIWFAQGTLTLRNAIIRGNRNTGATTLETQQFDTNGIGSFTLRSTSMEGLTTYVAPSDRNIDADPSFATSLGAGAAPFSTGDYRASSCALTTDAGDNAVVLGGALDLLGNARIFGSGTVDLGAYEALTTRTAAGTFTTQPASPVGCAGDTVTITAAFSGASPTYAWDVDTLDGLGFLPVVADAVHSNPATPTLTVHLLAATQHNWKYRVRVETPDGCRIVSSAVTTRVAATRYYVDATAAAGGDGRSWVRAYQTVTAALADPLLTQCGGSEIWVAAGTYNAATGHTLRANVAIIGGYPAGGGATRSPATNVVTLAAPATMSAVLASANVTGAVLDGVTLAGGTSAPTLELVNAGTPTFRNVRFGFSTGVSIGTIDVNNTSPVFEAVEFFGASGNTAYRGQNGVVTFNGLKLQGLTVTQFFLQINGTLRINNALITGNVLTDRLMSSSGSGGVDLRNVTIAGNNSARFLITGDVTRLYNSIVWGNRAPTSTRFLDTLGGEVRYSDIDGLLGVTLDNRLNVTPQFANPRPFSEAPTTAGNYTLDPCSPLIEGGSNPLSTSLTTDLAGAPRLMNGNVDLGAYEYQSTVLAVLTPPANASAPFGAPINFAVTTQLATTYQWQRNRSGGGFGNLSNGSGYAGVTTASLTVSAGSAVDGDQYRVVIADGGCRTQTSSAATFTLINNAVGNVATSGGIGRLNRSGDTVSATFSAALETATATSSGVAVHGLQTARHTAGVGASGAVLALAPGGTFAAGERVWITLKDSIQRTPTLPIRPAVLGYRAAVAAVPGALGGVAVTWPTDTAVTAMVAGDFNGDGAADLVASTSTGLFLWLNGGGGDFVEPTSLSGTTAAAKLYAGDLNSDGKLDLVTIAAGGTVAIWINGGSGTFTSGGTFATGAQAAALGDLDGDGDLDLFLARNGANQVWLNNGGGNFTDSGGTYGSANFRAVALGDFNGDAALDAIVVPTSGAPQLWINGGTAGFTAGAALAAATATDVAIGDLNNDGQLDVAFSHGDRAATLWWGNGGGTFVPAGTQGAFSVSLAAAAPSAQFDGAHAAAKAIDGNPATFYHNFASGSLLTLNVGGTTPVQQIVLTATDQAPVDGDYLKYMITVTGVRSDNSTVSFGLFFPSEVLTPGGTATLDLTGNTEVFPKMTLLFSARTSGQEIWVADVQLRGIVGDTAGAAANALELADFDGDGDLDLWLRGTDGQARRHNNSGGVFTAASDATHAIGGAHALADFGGFNALDLVHAPASGAGALLRLYRSFEVEVVQGMTHSFTAAQFSSRLTSTNQASVASYRIDTLPAFGVLKLGGVPVTAGQIIPTASLAALTFTGQGGYHGVDQFTWTARDGGGVTLETLTTHIHVLYVAGLPAIFAQSGSQAYTTYSPLTLSVTANGAAPLSYQWYLDDAAVPSATGATLTIPADRPDLTGVYTATVSNTVGTLTTVPMTISLAGRPFIMLPLASSTVGPGQIVNLSTSALGATPITYTWYRGLVGDRTNQVATGVTSFTTPALAATTAYWVEATNSAGAATSAATVTVNLSAPVISNVPANLTVNTAAGVATAVVSWTAPTATDDVAVASFTSTSAPGATFPLGTTTVTYTAVDNNGNQSTASFTITVRDAELPVVSGMPANIAVNTAAGVDHANVSWTAPTATDNVAVTSFTSTHAPGGQFAVGVTTVTYTAKDAANNTATSSFTVTVSDNQAPALTNVPANRSVTTAPNVTTATTTWTTPTATDNVAVTSLTANFASGDAFPIGTTTVTYTAKDAANNTTTASFTVTVIAADVTAPVITNVPANRTVTTAPNVATAVTTWTTPTATDNIGVTSFTANFASGDAFPIGTTTVTYTAKDAANNTTTASFTVTVVAADVTAPVIANLPANRSVTTDATKNYATVTWTAPTATDNVAVTSFTSTAASGAQFALGVTTVTYTALDAAGNQAQATFTITVTDAEVPAFTNVPANRTINTAAGLATATNTWTAPTATDNVGVTSLTATHAPGATFPLGTTTVTYTAQDAANNTATASFTVTVVDAELPIISNVPADITVPASGGVTSAVVTWTAPTASDNVGVTSFTSTHAPGASFPVGVTTVTYTARDAANNIRTASFTITVGGAVNLVVTSAADSGAGTLRDALAQATGADEYRITFSPGLTGAVITLTTVGDTVIGDSAFVVTKPVTIDATGLNQITLLISGPRMRHFRVAAGGSLTLKNITFAEGLLQGSLGARGDVSGGGGGGAGMGGSIFNEGTLLVENGSFQSNHAIGGNGAGFDVNPNPGGGNGGGPNGGLAHSVPISGQSTVFSGGAGGFGGGGGGGGGDSFGATGNRSVGGFGGGDGGGVASGGVDTGGNGGFGGGGGGGTKCAGGGGAGLGGAIFNHGGTATFKSVQFTFNTSAGGTQGGGSFVNGSPGTSYGAAIFSHGGTLVLESVTFANDAAPPNSGREVYCYADGAVANLILINTSLADFNQTTINSGSLAIGGRGSTISGYTPRVQLLATKNIYVPNGAITVPLTLTSAGGTPTVTATSSNTSILPNSAIALLTGPDRLVVTPPPGASGIVDVNVTITDGGKSFTQGIRLTILSTLPTAVAFTGTVQTGTTLTVPLPISNPLGLPVTYDYAGPYDDLNGDWFINFSTTPVSVRFRSYSGFVGTAKFYYSITHEFGTSSAPVTLTVVGPNVPRVTVQFRALGGAIVTVAGVANTSYTLAVSTDLTNWSTLTTVTTDAQGAATYQDTTAPAPGAARFYRATRIN